MVLPTSRSRLSRNPGTQIDFSAGGITAFPALSNPDKSELRERQRAERAKITPHDKCPMIAILVYMRIAQYDTRVQAAEAQPLT